MSKQEYIDMTEKAYECDSKTNYGSVDKLERIVWG